MIKTLVTGVSGMVGHAVEFINPGVLCPNPHSYDLRVVEQVEQMFLDYSPDQVIHLAARVGGLKANMDSPADFFTYNAQINTNLVDAAYKYGVKKMVCFLSTCVFPDPCPLPLQPKSLHAGPPHPSNYGYAYAKRMLAVQCQAYNEQHGVQYIPVIPCNMYGPHDNFSLETGHAVPSLIHKMWLAKKHGQPVKLWGTGKPLREFLYSFDAAKLCFEVLDKYTLTEPLIFSPGQEHSIADLADCIKKAMCFEGDILFDDTKPDGQYQKTSDSTPLRALLPDFKFSSLEEGVQSTVNWFISRWPNVRL